MKIAMIGQKGLPATYGGVERHCEELGSRLAAMGCDVTVFCRPYYSSRQIRKEGLERISSRRYLYKGMTLEIVPSIPTKHLDAASHSFFCSIPAVTRNYDIVHYHALGPTLFSVIPRMFGRKTVATVHGLDWQRAKWGRFAKAMLRKGEEACSRFPDGVIVVSKTLKEYFRTKHNKDTFYIPNGINQPEKMPPREIRVRWHVEKGGYILFVGRLVPEKGAHYLIEAFRDIKTDKALVIAGGDSHSGDYIKTLKDLAHGDGRILFTDYIYGPLLDEVYSNPAFYVHPSDIEGLPLCLLEAMSYGAGVLASDIPENAEVIAPDGREQNGFLFPRGNVGELRKRMEYLLDHPMMTQGMGATAEEYVLKHYNWDLIAEETLGVYRKMLESKHGATEGAE